ncbi:MAG TPA: tetratricopeptide repeat protein, partial [Steroidobacteraceae bacterium]|nr:tetratricopeptide repeat protein [Steroidobacteraceae bacterium]
REKLQVLNRYLEGLIRRKDFDPLGQLLAIPKDQLMFLIHAKDDTPPPAGSTDRWLRLSHSDVLRMRATLLERFQRLDAAVLASLLFEIAYHHQQLKRYDDCIRRYELLVFLFAGGEPAANSTAISAHYNLACIYALQGDKEKALDELEAAIKIGFYDFGWAQEDRDLASLREEPRFKALLSVQPSGGGPAEPPSAVPSGSGR